ncbi:hypothetical protein ACQUSR_29220 [Streptomyces sp. P1-3]|uniref:hypothetical protein n=1 Tax=Streptomyces sp. P1-3 TaxID=3421658 RepID=UPI003D367D0D
MSLLSSALPEFLGSLAAGIVLAASARGWRRIRNSPRRHEHRTGRPAAVTGEDRGESAGHTVTP